jgi:hypothetical protein
LLIDLTFDSRLQKPAAKMNSASWIARFQGVRGLLLFTGSKTHQLCCHSCTRL